MQINPLLEITMPVNTYFAFQIFSSKKGQGVRCTVILKPAYIYVFVMLNECGSRGMCMTSSVSVLNE